METVSWERPWRRKTEETCKRKCSVAHRRRTNISFTTHADLEYIYRFPLCASTPSGRTKICTNDLLGTGRWVRDTHNHLSETALKLSWPRLLPLHRPTSPLFKLFAHSQWVRNDHKLSQLSCPRIVCDDYKLFYLGRRTATYGDWIMVVRIDRSLLNITFLCTALRFIRPPQKLR